MPSQFKPKSWHSYFILVMSWLGIRYFKKWWPSGGSFWNNKHINPSNNHQLKDIIKTSWNAIQGHAVYSAGEFTIMFLMGLTEYIEIDKVFKYLAAMTTYHLLALLVNWYNIILAQYRIERNRRIKETKVVKPKELLEIKGDSDYIVYFGYQQLSPKFPTFSQAKEYRDYLYQEIGQDAFRYEELVFLNEHRVLYRKYRGAG